jgi:BON domain
VSAVQTHCSMNRALIVIAVAALCIGRAASNELHINEAGDPVIQVTNALPDCTVVKPQIATPSTSEKKTTAHGRIERGTTCYNTGRCRLPSSYSYDREIIPRVKKALTYDDAFANTTIVAEGSRRWVWLRGCVATEKQKKRAEEIVRNIDDVEHVINELRVEPEKRNEARRETPKEQSKLKAQ